MIISILAIGNEVLKGKTINTNASTISKRLNELGYELNMHLVVRDRKEDIKSALSYLYQTSDVVITTGGLGPTVDDITRESIADFFDEKLVVNKDLVNHIQAYFKSTGREMPRSNIKQASYPQGAVIINNNNGTAPGMYFEKNSRTLIMLPGPPRELNPMLEEVVIPKLKEIQKPTTLSKRYRIMGIGESHAEELLEPLYKKYDHVEIAPYASVGVIDFILTINKESNQTLLEEACMDFEGIMKGFIIGDQSKHINERVVETLIEKNLTLGIAESCTGGMLSSMIVDVSGSSSALLETCVTYSNESKMMRLDVKKETLEEHGAVSRETATEMSEGITKVLGTDIGLSVTGIAGPSGGTEEKPVGLVYAAITWNQETEVYKFNFTGSRKTIRTRAALSILHKLYKKINNK